MTLIEISNLFSIVTAVHPNFKNYHFGWPSDMARNVTNNYDPNQETGTLYPAVLVAPPEIQLNPGTLKTVFSFRVHFMDLQAYDNATDVVIDTKLEQWAKLFEYGLQWFREVQNANKQLPKPSYIDLKSSSPAGGLMEAATQRRLIYLYFDFELETSSECTNLGINYPDDVTAAGMSWPPYSAFDGENTYSANRGLLVDDSELPLFDDEGDGLIPE